MAEKKKQTKSTKAKKNNKMTGSIYSTPVNLKDIEWANRPKGKNK